MLLEILSLIEKLKDVENKIGSQRLETITKN